MKVVSLSDLKRRLSLTIRLVKNGESLVILDRGRPLARFTPLSAAENWENILDALARTGDVGRAERPLPDLDWIANGRKRDRHDSKGKANREAHGSARAHEKVLPSSSGVAQSPQLSGRTVFIVTLTPPFASEISENSHRFLVLSC